MFIENIYIIYIYGFDPGAGGVGGDSSECIEHYTNDYWYSLNKTTYNDFFYNTFIPNFPNVYNNLFNDNVNNLELSVNTGLNDIYFSNTNTIYNDTGLRSFQINPYNDTSYWYNTSDTNDFEDIERMLSILGLLQQYANLYVDSNNLITLTSDEISGHTREVKIDPCMCGGSQALNIDYSINFLDDANIEGYKYRLWDSSIDPSSNREVAEYNNEYLQNTYQKF